MKKIIYIIAMLVAVTSANAQSIMSVHLKNGRTITYMEDEIESVDFSKGPTHKYVNLNLPSGTLWATCNIGASNPEDYGYYFAWGETTPYGEQPKSYPAGWTGEKNMAYLYKKPKLDFSWPYYMWGDGNYLLKYNTLRELETDLCPADDIVELLPEDDAASVFWDEDWCTPSLDQYYELLDQCLCLWTNNYCKTGVPGLLVLEMKASNMTYSRYPEGYEGDGVHLFLPAAGDIDYDYLSNPARCGFYWTNLISSDDPKLAYVMDFNIDGLLAPSLRSRCYGRSVRPVYKKN